MPRYLASSSVRLCQGLGALIAGVLVMLALARCEQAPSPSTSGTRKVVTVATASDLQYAFVEIQQRFCELNPLIDVVAVYGSSQTFLAQLSAGAPFDLFLSADVESPKALVNVKRAYEDSYFEYGASRLVIWVRSDSGIDISAAHERALLDPTLRRIAMANPQSAPCGKAAMEALQALGMAEAVKEKLLLGESVAQAAQFVEAGEAQAGILSLPLTHGMKTPGNGWEIPLTTHKPLVQAGVIPKRVKDLPSARALRAFLLSPTGSAILDRYGFSTPGPD